MKQFYTFIIMLFMGLTINSQTLLTESTEQFGNLIVTTKTYEDGSIEHHLRTAEAVTTDLTNWLVSQSPCGFSGGCETLILGCCFGDGLDHPDSTECMFPEFQDYTCQVDLELVWDTFRLEHCTFTMLNGTSIINNGIDIVESTFCDVGDEVTQYIFEGGGQEFQTMAEFEAYQQTLSTTTEKITVKNVFDLIGKTYYLYDAIGRNIYSGPITQNTKTDLKQFSGLYFLRVVGYNNTLKIVN